MLEGITVVTHDELVKGVSGESLNRLLYLLFDDDGAPDYDERFNPLANLLDEYMPKWEKVLLMKETFLKETLPSSSTLRQVNDNEMGETDTAEVEQDNEPKQAEPAPPQLEAVGELTEEQKKIIDIIRPHVHEHQDEAPTKCGFWVTSVQAAQALNKKVDNLSKQRNKAKKQPSYIEGFTIDGIEISAGEHTLYIFAKKGPCSDKQSHVYYHKK